MDNQIQLVKKFTNLPDTKEKTDLEKQFLNDEIGSLDFYIKAKSYIDSVEGEDEQ